MEKSSSKVLSGSATGDAQQWVPPSMGETNGKGAAKKHNSGSMLTAEQLEQLQKEAYDEGFALGKKEGFAYGHKESLTQGQQKIDQLIAQVETLMATLDLPLHQLDEQVERELVELVISMVRQLVRREIRMEPSHIIGIVRESLSILPVSSRHIRVHLHPEDAQLVRSIYDMSDKEQGWKIIEDPVLARGGCRVITETSQIDATLESRLAAMISRIMGGERDEDASDKGET
ncbi:MAG: flagellar assembly protein FliH [Sedimenticola sp.]|nr:flagellar assembly protein FliH [Sedimenticola sp.]MCW8920944.1 flagellar assembly protein FliH [Sedimenticola sp.]MCW8947237.1 flagellar assembly protein FliH [Sedimenticola sp.]MCW8976457.1 flagellar assembly protein FliH [Sedimenticola sp.]